MAKWKKLEGLEWREDFLTHYYIHAQKSKIIKIFKDKYDFNRIMNSLTFKK